MTSNGIQVTGRVLQELEQEMKYLLPIKYASVSCYKRMSSLFNLERLVFAVPPSHSVWTPCSRCSIDVIIVVDG